MSSKDEREEFLASNDVGFSRQLFHRVYNDRERLKAECEQLRSLLDNMNAQLELRASTQAYDAWYWQGDGQDHLESMSNGMSVVIRAGQLRELIETERAKGRAPESVEDLNRTYPGFAKPVTYHDLARLAPEDLFPLWQEGKHGDVSPGAAFAAARAIPCISSERGAAEYERDEQVPGMPEGTTFEDLACMNCEGMFNRWLDLRGTQFVSAREAFVAARRIPFFRSIKLSSPLGLRDTTTRPANGYITQVDRNRLCDTGRANNIDISNERSLWFCVPIYVGKSEAHLVKKES